MIVIVSIISFILEFLINYIFSDSCFYGLIVLSTLILVEPFFKRNKNLFFVFCFVMGFFYDFIYTGTYFMNAGLFMFIGLIVSFVNNVTPNNFFVSIFELFLLICFYRFLSFIFFVVNGVVSFDFSLLFKSMYCSFLINVIYGVVLYFILCFLSRLFKIKRIK